MTTECNQFVFGFHPQKRRGIRAQFDGGTITSDGGKSHCEAGASQVERVKQEFGEKQVHHEYDHR
jgi:hypothetical protein